MTTTYAEFQDDKGVLGKCCACQGTQAKYIVFLSFKAPVAGTGWGCLVCHKPQDGAIAVLCQSCIDEKRQPTEMVYGDLANHERVQIVQETRRIPFNHDYHKHPELAHLN